MRRRIVAALTAGLLAATACADDDAGDSAPTTAAPDASSSDADDSAAPTTTPTADADDAAVTTAPNPTTAASEAESDVEPATDTATDTADAKPEPARTAGEVDAPAGVQPDGFTTVNARITSADGEVCDVCLWLADTADERGRGLMSVTDLGEPVGMLFRFDRPTAGRFFMFGTPMPLSIAWFDADGGHVSQTDMGPCLVDDSASCERYGADAGYVFAVEMVQGELGVIGIGPGSRLEVLDEAEACQAAS
ncbi:MAG: DUF192 domain-containing protein [Actinomycetota bacterium]